MRTIKTWNILHYGDEVIGFSNGMLAVRRSNETVELWEVKKDGTLPSLPAVIIGYADTAQDTLGNEDDQNCGAELYTGSNGETDSVENTRHTGTIQIIDF